MFKPNFTITPEMVTAISHIAEIKATVERSRVLPLNEAQLRRQAIVRMAHTSTSIEGNKLAEYQVDKVLSGMSVNADKQSIIEVKNYQQALKKIEELAEEKKPITIQTILDIHSILMQDLLPKEKSGHFRPGTIFIVDDLGNGKEILRFEGPPAEKVAHLVNELLLWVEHSKKVLHPILIAGIFHTQFVHIHPFADGNGRITRLLTQLILYILSWDFRKIIVLEDFYNQDRQDYYNHLADGWDTKYAEGCDLNPWLEYFFIGFLLEARKVTATINALGFGSPGEGKAPIYLDQDEVKIMDFVVNTHQIRSKDIEKLLGIAKRTAQLKLKNLVEKKLIQAEGRGPSTYYILAS
jgi:Fic family protein